MNGTCERERKADCEEHIKVREKKRLQYFKGEFKQKMTFGITKKDFINVD